MQNKNMPVSLVNTKRRQWNMKNIKISGSEWKRVTINLLNNLQLVNILTGQYKNNSMNSD